MKKHILLLIFCFFFAESYAQHTGIGAKGGLTVGIGAQGGKRPLISYHGNLMFEYMGKWQGDNQMRRLGFLAYLGYHRRGTSYNTGTWGSNSNYTANDVFHNISLSTLLKGSFNTGAFMPYYAAGLRLDVTASSAVINQIDAQGVTPVNLGLWLGGGLEWEPPKLPFGLFLEINVSPDLTPQIFFPKGTQVLYYPYGSQTSQTRTFSEDYRIINVSVEVSFGIKLILRKNDDPEEL